MASEKFVVLRAPGLGATGVLGPTLESTALRNIEFHAETHDLTPGAARDVARDPESLAVAPVMPVSLVAPLDAVPSRITAEGEVTWGVRAVGAATSPFTGAGVTVAVLDTGIDAAHEAFQGKTIVQKDFTGEGDGDGNGHGTHCAGTIFGGPVGGTRIGVAPGVSRVLIGKVLDARGSGSTDQILDGLLWATREGANVISMSIGFDFPGLVDRLVKSGMDVRPATSRALAMYRENMRLFDTLANLVKAHGQMFSKTLLVAASGNESNRPQWVIGTAPPAAADGIVSVGALGQGGQGKLTIAPFSNGAPDVAAPGVAVSSAKVGGGLRALSGTSMATPHVAGVAALWFERVAATHPAFQVAQIEGQLLARAVLDPMAPNEELADVGAGLVQAPA